MSNSKLFRYFAGRFVNVIMKNVKGAQLLKEGVVAEGNVIIEGFLLDEDDKFYYLGTDDTKIDDALLKDDLVRIFMDKEEDIVEFEEVEGDRH